MLTSGVYYFLYCQSCQVFTVLSEMVFVCLSTMVLGRAVIYLSAMDFGRPVICLSSMVPEHSVIYLYYGC